MRARAAGACSRPVDHGLAPAQSAAAHQGAELALHLVEKVAVARAPEAANLEVLGNEEEEVARARRRLGRVVLRDRTADRDPPAPPQRADRRLEVVAADVVEIDVDPIRRGFPQKLGDRPIVVVERRVETELPEQVRDLLRRARAPDDPMTAELRELGDDAPDRACRRRHPDLVALTEAGHPQEARVRREAVGPEQAEVRLRRCVLDVEAPQRAEATKRLLTGGDDRVVPPAGCVPDGVALGEPVGPRLDHLADRHDPVHRRPEREGDEVPLGSTLAEPQAKPGIDRRPRVADEHLAGTDGGDRSLHDLEVGLPHLTAREGDEVDLASRERRHRRASARTSRPILSAFRSSRSTPTARVPM